jgi:modification methylase
MEMTTNLVFIEQEANDYDLVQIAQSITDFVTSELQQITNPAQAIEMKAKVGGAAEYIKKAIGDRELKLKAANDLTLSRIRIERWLGGWLRRNIDNNNQVKRSGNRTSLPDLGVSKNKSSDYQAQAQVPESDLMDWVIQMTDSGKQLTSSHVINWGKRIKKAQQAETARAKTIEIEKELPDTSHKDCLFKDDLTSLWHGNAADLTFIKSETVDLIVTSPPYNIGPKTGNGRILWGGINYNTHNDIMPEPDYQQWQIDILNELWRVTKKGGSLFYNHKVRNRKGKGIHPLGWILKSDWDFRQQITWDRGSTHNKEMSYFWPHDELIFWLTKGTDSVYLSSEGARMSTVWRFGFKTNTDHPAPFPKVLPARCIRAASKPGDLILDPFGGSMTTCHAARELKRRSIGVDISREYVIKYAKHLTQGVLL